MNIKGSFVCRGVSAILLLSNTISEVGRHGAPRQSAPETMCLKTIRLGDYLPRRQPAQETTCPGRQHAPETICPGDYMPRDNVHRRHHAQETIRPGFKIHYWYSTMLG